MASDSDQFARLRVGTLTFTLFFLQACATTSDQRYAYFLRRSNYFRGLSPLSILRGHQSVSACQASLRANQVQAIRAALNFLRNLLLHRSRICLFRTNVTTMFHVRLVRFCAKSVHAFLVFFTFARYFSPQFNAANDSRFFYYRLFAIISLFLFGVFVDARTRRRLVRVCLIDVRFQSIRASRLHLSSSHGATDTARSNPIRRGHVRENSYQSLMFLHRNESRFRRSNQASHSTRVRLFAISRAFRTVHRRAFYAMEAIIYRRSRLVKINTRLLFRSGRLLHANNRRCGRAITHLVGDLRSQRWEDRASAATNARSHTSFLSVNNLPRQASRVNGVVANVRFTCLF